MTQMVAFGRTIHIDAAVATELVACALLFERGTQQHPRHAQLGSVNRAVRAHGKAERFVWTKGTRERFVWTSGEPSQPSILEAGSGT